MKLFMAMSLCLSIYRQEVCHLNNKSSSVVVVVNIKNAKNKWSCRYIIRQCSGIIYEIYMYYTKPDKERNIRRGKS